MLFSNDNILNCFPDIFFATNQHWRVIYSGDKFKSQFELNDPSITIWELIPDLLSCKQYILNQTNKILNSIGTYRYEAYCENLGMWFEIILCSTQEHSFVALFRDISDQKKAWEQLQLFESVVICANDAIIITEAFPIEEPGPRILYVNEAFLLMTGYSREEVIGRSPRFLQGPNTKRADLDKIKKALQKWEPILVEVTNYRKDGSEFLVELSLVPVFNSNGWVDRWIAIQRETTERTKFFEEQQKRRKAEEWEKYYRVIAESIPQIVWTARPDGYVDYFNSRWFEYTGLSKEDSLGWNWYKALLEDVQLEKVEFWQRAIQKGETFEGEYQLLRASDGMYRWHLERAMPVFDEKGKIIRWFGTSTDIHDQKIAQLTIQENEARLRRLVEANVIGVLIKNTNGKIVEANQAFLEMVGYSREELESGELNWHKLTPSDQPNLWEQNYSELAREGVIKPFEKEYVRRDGSKVPVIVGGALLDEIKKTYITFVLDITERKDADRRKDEFISMASHELKTPLTSAKIFTEILFKILQKSNPDDALLYISKITQQIDKLTKLINDLLNISKINLGKLEYIKEEVEIEPLVDEVIKNYSHSLKRHKIKIEGRLIGCVMADRAAIEQVLTNLLENAVKYSPQADEVIVKKIQACNEVIISVQDFGIGIAKENYENLFKRFYRVMDTNEKTFPGLGIGLYIASEIIQKHKGRIWVESIKGKGSVFSFALPLVG